MTHGQRPKVKAYIQLVSALGAVVSAKVLHGWYVYLGFAIVAIGLFIGFILWNRKY